MNQGTQNIFDQSFKVPIVSPDSSTLLETLMEPDLGIEEILAEIQKVSGVVAKLISLANSAWSNPVTTVTGIDEACTRLGLNIIRTVSIGVVVGKTFDPGRCKYFDPSTYWTSSMVTSNTAALLSSHFQVDATTARTAGLLHNIGLLLLADRFPDSAAAVLEENLGNEPSLNARLEKNCGIGYWEAGSRLLDHWNLPDALVRSLQDPASIQEDQFSNLRELVRLAATLSSSVCHGDPLIDISSEHVDDSSLRQIFDEQTSNLRETTELTKLFV